MMDNALNDSEHEQALVEAIDVAQNEGRPVIVRVWQARGDRPRFTPKSVPWLYYREPERFDVWALGTAWHVSGPRLQDVLSDVDAVRHTIVDLGDRTESDSQPPLLFGGSAFSPRVSQMDAPWRSWPSASLFIPAVMYFANHIGQWLVRIAVVTAESTLDDLQAQLSGPIPEASDLTIESDANDQGHVETSLEWTARISDDAIHQFSSSGLKKVVLARAAFDALTEPPSLTDACHRLSLNHPSCGVFALSLVPRECFIGASPEILVEHDTDVVKAHAVAGTLPRGASAR